MIYDVIIIGAGIVGGAIFRELNKYELSTLLLEAENDVAAGSSRANSAIVHAGYDPPFGSLMAKYNVEGNRLYQRLCSDLSVAFKNNGSLILAFDDEDQKTLVTLLNNGTRNGVPGLKILDAETVLQMEPHLNSTVQSALYAPSGGIVGAYELTIALIENGVINGGKLKLNAEVVNIERKIESEATINFPFRHSDNKQRKNQNLFANNNISEKKSIIFELSLSNGEKVQSRFLINAAGINSAIIHNLVSTPDFIIRPRKGEYFILDRSEGNFVQKTIFRCPSKLGKGVLISPTVHGNLIVGPDAQDISDRYDVSTTAKGLDFVRQNALELSNKIQFRQSIRNFAGIRALSDKKDFIISRHPEVPQMIDVAGIKSPGLTSAPAIAVEMTGMLADCGLELIEKQDFNPNRFETHFMNLSAEEKEELIRREPMFGRIICRCESITEGEIVEAIRRPVGATTLDGVKRRCRPGCGRCQGGFCGPQVLDILACELHLNREEIVQDKKNSTILFQKTK